MKSLFKKESLLMTLIVIIYGFIAGGSSDDSISIGVSIVIICGIIIMVLVVNVKDKKKRLEIKKDFESKETEFDMSDKIGDDQFGLYFDKHKEKVLIASIKTSGIEKIYIDDFKKQIVKYGSKDYYLAIDADRGKALFIKSKDNFNHKVIKYRNNFDTNEKINNDIPIRLYADILKEESDKPNVSATFILLEEKYGYISIFKDMSLKSSFSYIKKDYIAKKKGETAFVLKRLIGSYVFIMDDFFKILVIISPLISTYKILNYSDIINVTFEENGNTLYSKSMSRTIGGAIVGGALIGGAGAIVGGLSGDTTQNKKVQSMDIKILVRSTTTPSINLPINLKGETFNTKDESSKKIYQTRIQEANSIKDLISVIIDNSNQQSVAIPTSEINEEPMKNTGIADELAKLAQLKDSGILSEEEFQEQKRKLLN